MCHQMCAWLSDYGPFLRSKCATTHVPNWRWPGVLMALARIGTSHVRAEEPPRCSKKSVPPSLGANEFLYMLITTLGEGATTARLTCQQIFQPLRNTQKIWGFSAIRWSGPEKKSVCHAMPNAHSNRSAMDVLDHTMYSIRCSSSKRCTKKGH